MILRANDTTPVTLVTCDDLCGSTEHFSPGSDLHTVATVARLYGGWQVQHVYGDHYKCRCLGCLSKARAAA